MQNVKSSRKKVALHSLKVKVRVLKAQKVTHYVLNKIKHDFL